MSFRLNKPPTKPGTFVPGWERGETLWNGSASCLFLRHAAQRFAQRDHNRLAGRRGEGQLQVAAVFDFAAELTKLIGTRVDDISLHIGHEDPGAGRDDFRIA